MTVILINLPDNIKQEITKVTKQLGLSRAEFIKQAITNELDNFKKKTEEYKIAKSLQAMKKSKTYISESAEIMDNLNWWTYNVNLG